MPSAAVRNSIPGTPIVPNLPALTSILGGATATNPAVRGQMIDATPINDISGVGASTPGSNPTGAISVALLNAQAMKDAALRTLNNANANLDAQDQEAKLQYQQQLDASNRNRGKSLTAQRESDASRGFLNSGNALNNQADVNEQFDLQNSGYKSSVDHTLGQDARDRLAAQNAWSDAQTQFENWRTADLTPESPGTPAPAPAFDPSDPLGWQHIAAALRENPALAPTPVTANPAAAPVRQIAPPKPVAPRPIAVKAPVVTAPVKPKSKGTFKVI